MACRSKQNNPPCGHCEHLIKADLCKDRGIPETKVRDYFCGHPDLSELSAADRWCGFAPMKVDDCPFGIEEGGI